MSESRRDRKKRQTRRHIAKTALRLFGEQGYEKTTVVQITAAADVATKTFFNHFPSKEDVVFEEFRHRFRIPAQVIEDRGPEESVAEVLTRMYDVVLADHPEEGGQARTAALLETYARLVTEVPALQAKALHLSFDLQHEASAALVEAFPDELDPLRASAVVGALVGAIQGAALASLERGESAEQFWAAMRLGRDIGLRALD